MLSNIIPITYKAGKTKFNKMVEEGSKEIIDAYNEINDHIKTHASDLVFSDFFLTIFDALAAFGDPKTYELFYAYQEIDFSLNEEEGYDFFIKTNYLTLLYHGSGDDRHRSKAVEFKDKNTFLTILVRKPNNVVQFCSKDTYQQNRDAVDDFFKNWIEETSGCNWPYFIYWVVLLKYIKTHCYITDVSYDEEEQKFLVVVQSKKNRSQGYVSFDLACARRDIEGIRLYRELREKGNKENESKPD